MEQVNKGVISTMGAIPHCITSGVYETFGLKYHSEYSYWGIVLDITEAPRHFTV